MSGEPTPDAVASDVSEQRAAVAALGAELRRLNERAVGAAAEPEELRRLTARVRELADGFEEVRRPHGPVPEVDHFPSGLRMYSPVTGAGNPFAPPLVTEPLPDGVRGRCTLGRSHEGPPRFAHGGVTAMILDEIMGWACRVTGKPAMTVGLDLSYARPVPIGAPLTFEAFVTGRRGRTILVHGRATAEANPETTLVEARGAFVTPEPDQVKALFPGVEHLL